eukprot:g4650.t1
MRALCAALAVLAASAQQPEDCLETAWQPWSACSLTCGEGKGTRTRTRDIAVHPQGTGRACGNLTETEACGEGACPEPVDCAYSEWSAWSTCSKECLDADGVKGLQLRSRRITTRAVDGGTACDYDTLSQERECGLNACEAQDCVLSNMTDPWGPWAACSKTCGGGTQTREKKIFKPAMHGGACDLDALQGRESQACNADACPTEPAFNLTGPDTGIVLTNMADVANRVLVVDGGATYTGGRKLYKLDTSTLEVQGGKEFYDPTPMTQITALAQDVTHLYVVGRQGNQHAVHRVAKDDAASSVKLALSRAVEAIAVDDGRLYISYAARDTDGGKGRLERWSAQFAPDSQPAAQHDLGSQGNALLFSNKTLWVGTWGGDSEHPALIKLDPDTLAMEVGDAIDMGVGQHVVALQADDDHVYAGIDADTLHIAKVAKDTMQKTTGASDNHGGCVSMTSDTDYLWCGTKAETGELVQIKKADLQVVKAERRGENAGRVYALGHGANNDLLAALYLAEASEVMVAYGYLSAKDCVEGPWSAWGVNCVDFFTKQKVPCGKGVKLAYREIRTRPLWGGRKCGALEKTKACEAKEAACCRGGTAWSRTLFKHNCETDETTEHLQVDSACRCPRNRPVNIDGMCVAPAQCNARPCKHTTCRYTASRVHVVHHGRSNPPCDPSGNKPCHGAGFGINHHCTFTPGRTGDCHCVCWEQKCGSDADCEWAAGNTETGPPPGFVSGKTCVTDAGQQFGVCAWKKDEPSLLHIAD